MAKTSKEERLEKGVQKAHQEILRHYDATDPDNLRIVELKFAVLIAKEGFTQKEAYMTAWGIEPKQIESGEYKEASIDQQACRIANKPRVKQEIERLRLKLRDQEVESAERMAFILDGAAVRNRTYLEVYSVMIGTTNDAIRLKAAKLLGEAKHVDAWVGTVNTSDASKMTLEASTDSSEIINQIKGKIMEANRRKLSGLIEVQAVGEVNEDEV